MNCWWRLVLVALLATACAGDQGDEVMARVGENRIEVTSFQAYLSAVTGGEPWQAIDRRVATRLLDQFLDQEVIAAAAPDGELSSIPNDPAARSRHIRRLVGSACGPAPPVSDQVFEVEVGRRMSEITPGRVHARQMLLEDEEAARSVRERLNSGEDWMALSVDESRAPNADRGGEIGFLQEGSLPIELEEVIFSLDAEEISEPVQGPSGYHIFQVLEIVPAGNPDRTAVEFNVRTELEQIEERKHLRDCVDRLAFEVGVEVHSDRLWFDYDGRYSGEEYVVQ